MVNFKPLFGEPVPEMMKTVIENAKNLRGSLYPVDYTGEHIETLQKAVLIEDAEERILVSSMATSLRYERNCKAEAYKALESLIQQLEHIRGGLLPKPKDVKETK